MLFKKLFLLLMIFFVSIKSYGKIQTKSVECTLAIFTYTWEDKNIKKDQFEKYLLLEPFCNQEMYSDLMDLNIKRCIKRESDQYINCDANQPDSPNFVHNAEITISLFKKKFTDFNKMYYPSELMPIKNQTLKFYYFVLWRETAKLNYIKTKNIKALKTNFKFDETNIDFETICQNILNDRQKIIDQTVFYDWDKCVSKYFKDRTKDVFILGSKVWSDFLKKYKIRVEEKNLD